MAVMAKRPRVYFDADEELRTAIQLEALKQGVTSSELIGKILRANLKASVAEARKMIQQREKKEPE